MLRGWQTPPRWPPCSEAGFALASLLHHSPSLQSCSGEGFRWLCCDISAVGVLYVRGGGAKLCCSSHTFQPRFVISAVCEAALQEPVTALALETDADKMKYGSGSTFLNSHTCIRTNTPFNLYVNRPIIVLSFTFRMTGQCQGASRLHILFII